MPQPAENAAPLSVHRAFVVHFRAATAVAQGQVAGRVEHVVSGQVTHFQSLQELLAFNAQVLAQRPDRPDTEGTRDSASE
jgi:hypothetical protein